MKNKVVAALLAFFLGWLGVHKFYLGETGTGILYLIFFWTVIPRLISFIEGIVYLCTPDRVFNAKYNRTIEATPMRATFSDTYRETYHPPRESTAEKANALGELKKLYEQDIITAEEYEEKRRKIFDSI